MVSLTVEGLSVRLGRHVAVRDVAVTLEPGQLARNPGVNNLAPELAKTRNKKDRLKGSLRRKSYK